MNKKVLAVAIGAALAAPAFAQSSNVTLYGRINTAIESNHTGNGGSEVSMQSYSSRLGVRGVEDLGGGNKAVFGLETQLASDGGNASSPFTALRNAYVGLDTGSTGRLVMGRLDAAVLAPLYNQISSVMDFVGYDTQANAFVMANGRNLGAYTAGTSNAGSNGAIAANTGGVLAPNSSNSTGQNDSTFAAVQRVSNAFGYQVKLGNVDVQARLALNGPNDVVPGNTGATGENNARNFEAVANYKLGKLTLGGGFEKASYSKVVASTAPVTEANAKAAFDSRFQAVAGYDFGVAKVGALFARNRIDATTAGRDDSGNEYGLSATLPLTPKADLVANYGRRDLLTNDPITAANPANAKRTQAAIGARYNLSSRTQAYAVYNRTDSNDKISNNEVKTIAVGLRHNF
jgi:predicted porin